MINATSKIANKAFDLMKRSIKDFIDKHGDDNARFQVFIHGDESTPREICYKSDIDKEIELKKGATKIPALHEDLKKINFRSNLEKVRECLLELLNWVRKAGMSSLV